MKKRADYKKLSGRHARLHKGKPSYLFLLFLVWFLVFIGLASVFGFQDALKTLEGVNAYWLVASVATSFSAFLVYSLNWNMLLRFVKTKPRLPEVFRAVLIGRFVDDVLPTVAPGGELAMGYVVSRQARVPLPKAIAAVIAQTIAWFIGFIVFTGAILAWLLYYGRLGIELAVPLLLLLAFFVLILLGFVHLSFNLKTGQKFAVLVFSRFFRAAAGLLHFKIRNRKQLTGWIEKTVKAFHRALQPFLEQRGILGISILSLAFHHFLGAMSFYFMLLAFGIQVPVAIAAMIFVITTLVSLLSFLPGGLFVYELASISLLSLVGASGTTAAFVLALGAFRLVEYWLVLFVGGFLALNFSFERLVGKTGF